MASTRGEEKERKKKQSATRKPGDAPLRSRNVSRYLSARWNVSSASSSMPCWHDIQSTRSWRIAALSSFEHVVSGEKTKSGQFCVFGVETPFARVARVGKACSARFVRAAAVQTREEAMEGVGARARAMATSAAIAIVRSGSRCGNVRREVAPASDRVERGVVAVAVAPSARVALGKDALSRLFAHLNKCPFST